MRSTYQEEAEDIRAAVEYLKCRGYSVVAIGGHSKGALCTEHMWRLVSVSFATPTHESST